MNLDFSVFPIGCLLQIDLAEGLLQTNDIGKLDLNTMALYLQPFVLEYRQTEPAPSIRRLGCEIRRAAALVPDRLSLDHHEGMTLIGLSSQTHFDEIPYQMEEKTTKECKVDRTDASLQDAETEPTQLV